jgi:hypothetical protein
MDPTCFPHLLNLIVYFLVEVVGEGEMWMKPNPPPQMQLDGGEDARYGISKPIFIHKRIVRILWIRLAISAMR